MAKTTITFPNGVTKVRYKTTNYLTTPEETAGRVKHIGNARFYFKKSLGKIIIRKSGVTRRSADVKRINQKLEALKGSPQAPAHKCGGRDWKDFVKCLKSEMKSIVGGGVTTVTPRPPARGIAYP